MNANTQAMLPYNFNITRYNIEYLLNLFIVDTTTSYHEEKTNEESTYCRIHGMCYLSGHILPQNKQGPVCIFF